MEASGGCDFSYWYWIREIIMQRLFIYILLIGLLIAGCAPVVAPSYPTSTPTAVPQPVDLSTPAPTPTSSADQLAAMDVIDAKLASSVGHVEGVTRVNSIELSGQTLEIELQSSYRTASAQSLLSYGVIRRISWLCTPSMEQQFYAAASGNASSIRIIVEPPDDQTVSFSTTNFQQCKNVASGILGFKDWIVQSQFAQAY
jgi:hypothetical protein